MYLPAYSNAKIIKIERVFPELWCQMYCHLFSVHSVHYNDPQTNNHIDNNDNTILFKNSHGKSIEFDQLLEQSSDNLTTALTGNRASTNTQ